MDDFSYYLTRQEIQDTLIRYAHALDSRQPELFAQVFTTDADLDYSSAGGIRGDRETLRAWLQEPMAKFEVWQHLLSNFIIEIDGDEASTITSCYNPLQGRNPDGSSYVLHVGCHYQDRLRNTPEGWRIYQRKLVVDWIDPAVEE